MQRAGSPRRLTFARRGIVRIGPPHIQGSGQLTDRYLLSLAAKRGGSLATWDGRLARSLPPDSPLTAYIELLSDAQL